MRIKHAKNLIKGNLCAAVICVTVPYTLYLLIKFAEYAIRLFFFPHYQTDLREIIILLFIILIHFILLYPLVFAKKLCFYNNCTAKRIPMCGIFVCYSAFSQFWHAAFTILIKKAVTFLLCGIMIIPSFWLIRLTFSGDFSVYWQIAAVLSAIAAIYLSAVIVYSLFLTEYIAVQTGKNPFYSMFASIRLMRKNRARLLMIKLKLIPYALLCVFIVPILYVLPLYEQTTALFANEIIFYSPALIPSSSEDI